jgi:hypothetical protein
MAKLDGLKEFDKHFAQCLQRSRDFNYKLVAGTGRWSDEQARQLVMLHDVFAELANAVVKLVEKNR